MTKKLGIGGAVLVAFVLALYFFLTPSETEKHIQLADKAVNLAGIVAGAYKGEVTTEDLDTSQTKGVPESVKEELHKVLEELESTNNNRVNLNDYYDEHIVEIKYDEEDEDTYTSLDVDENGNPISTFELLEELGLTEDEDYEPEPDDPRIYAEDGIDYINTNDLDFERGDYDIVLYNDAYMMVYRDDIEPTFDMLKTDKNNAFQYETYKIVETKGKEKDDFVDVLYTTATNDRNLIVRVYFDKKYNINGLEVR